ncbi:MAG TPA: polysaccharide deacetylase family protein [Blastocatellia bacterium]
MKNAILRSMQATGAFAPFRFANRGKALIVMYHRFSREEGTPMVSARAFAEQLDYLSSHYQIVPLSYVAERLASRRRLPPRIAVLTIDDAYSDVYEIAFPVLRERALPATVFVVTDFAERKTWLWTDKLRFLTTRAEGEQLEFDLNGRALRCKINDPASRLEAAARINARLKMLEDRAKEEMIFGIADSLSLQLPAAPPPEFASITWDEAREMDSNGVEIGSHTVTHPILTNIPLRRLRHELNESRARLESELARKVDLFCYPNGNFNLEVRGEVERAGYSCAVTSIPGFADCASDPLALRRISTEFDMPHFIQSTSGFERVKSRLLGRSKGGL